MIISSCTIEVKSKIDVEGCAREESLYSLLPIFFLLLQFSVHYEKCAMCADLCKDALQRAGQFKYVPYGRQHEMNKGFGVSSTATNSVGVGPQGSEMLSSMLAAAPPEKQKQILGERLYPLVQKHKVLQEPY